VAYGTVSDDAHAIFMPPVVKLSDVWIDGKRADDITLVIYDGSLRGEFYLKERLGIRGRLIRVKRDGREFPALSVSDAGDITRQQFVKGVPTIAPTPRSA
jgi:hypothetical protein